MRLLDRLTVYRVDWSWKVVPLCAISALCVVASPNFSQRAAWTLVSAAVLVAGLAALLGSLGPVTPRRLRWGTVAVFFLSPLVPRVLWAVSPLVLLLVGHRWLIDALVVAGAAITGMSLPLAVALFCAGIGRWDFAVPIILALTNAYLAPGAAARRLLLAAPVTAPQPGAESN